MIVDIVNSCDIDIRKDMYQNIILCGGNSLLGGIVEKIQKKVTESTN
jgi:actin-like protein 6A